ncbi:DNA adenine methylase [Sphingomonas koreensis]|jgi:adenine-specific DNA-methyltransferase|uniref:DNA adenine methylase n=1 Tax=Sphingomonas koreensis TaxID=93064 RepID=UPI00234E66F1|nr:DNA adenine methylase [Sphingomonas koreensis]MDC7812838.1 DNA adenine methylase [Sphingomonas koreensis]
MGSKRAMLGNGLGEALSRSLIGADRVFDLFTGSAAVAWHVAERHGKEVIASDLQQYSTILAAAVIERTEPITDLTWVGKWLEDAKTKLADHQEWKLLNDHQASLVGADPAVAACDARTIDLGDAYPISKAYGGHYFSPWQAAWVDALRTSLPSSPMLKNLALAALIQAASRCAASPGHTAQPFKPNDTAGPFLLEAWQRDLPSIIHARIKDLGPRYAKVRGVAHCGDALSIADQARAGDLAFVDPPYSGVHYSRFYHVLETIARGHVGQVTGHGRYPPAAERPSSSFSMKRTAEKAFDDLLARLAARGARVIITFPASQASNGLSGSDVKQIAAEHFRIAEEKVTSRFSTLGGDTKHRAARLDTDELILSLSAHA